MQKKSSAVVEMADHLATINMGRGLNRKSGGCCAPFPGGAMGPHLTQCGLGQGLPPHQKASSSIQPFGHNTPTLQTDNGPIAWSKPLYKRSPKNVSSRSLVDRHLLKT